MKILIVDDELLVRIGIKSCINWQDYGMEVVGEAADGTSALELLRSLDPDVMLLDIKMPNMDGIELLHIMRAEKIKCKVLILSGFDDVYHVKEAMRCGAIDYFHKPCMSPKDILNTLLEIKGEMEIENIPGKLQESTNISKEAFLRDLVEGRISDNKIFSSINSSVTSKLQDKNFSCIVFLVKAIEEVKKRYINSGNTLQSSILNVLNGVFSKEQGIEFFAFDNNTYVTIKSFANILSEKKIIEETASLIDIIIDAVKQFINVDIVLGVGDLHTSCKEIRYSFNEAIKAINYKFFKEDRDIIYYRDIKRQNSNRDTLLYVNSIITKLRSNLEEHEYSEFKNNLESFVCYLEQYPCLNEEDIKKLFNAFLFLISEGKSYFEEIEMFNSCKSLRQLHNTWLEIMEHRVDTGKSLIPLNKCSLLTKNIVGFIQNNYSREITLNLLSKHFNVSPNYISRLFKEETGETLFNYINEVRVEKAKRLLKDIDLKIYEVSTKVGFKSPVHFNIVFNKYTGITPKQFRDESGLKKYN